MLSTYVRILHTHAFAEKSVKMFEHDLRWELDHMVVNGYLDCYASDTKSLSEFIKDNILQDMQGAVLSRGECPEILQKIIAFCIYEGAVISTKLVDISCTLNVDMSMIQIKVTSNGESSYIFYDIDSAQIYTLSCDVYGKVISYLRDYFDDMRYKKFCHSVDALPVLLPSAVKTMEPLAYHDKGNTLSAVHGGNRIVYPCTYAGLLQLATECYTIIVNRLRLLSVETVAPTDATQVATTVRLFEDEKITSVRADISCRTHGDFTGVRLRNRNAIRAFAYSEKRKLIVLLNCTVQDVIALQSKANSEDAYAKCVAAVTGYMSAYSIDNVAEEMLRLMKLAGFEDVENKLIDVVDDLTRDNEASFNK